MEDARIEELEDAALLYKKFQKKRMAALAKEVEQKDALLAIMKAQKRKHYQFEDTEIEIVATKEKLVVKIKKQDDDEGAEE